MRIVGRWSIASVINFFITLTSFGAVFEREVREQPDRAAAPAMPGR